MAMSTFKSVRNLSIATGTAWLFSLAPLYLWAGILFVLGHLPISSLKSLVTFAYYCFLQPLGKSVGQQARLDRFYQGQAGVYDRTRNGLLKGRKKMLRLLASEIKQREMPAKGLVWVDVGGGTGWNIKRMHELIPLEHFEAIYLVDLCEPLLEVARQRLAMFPNVHVLKADATSLELDIDQVHVVTMSYSLSMIPSYFKVVDRVLEILCPDGLVSVVDFFTSNKDDSACEPNRQGNLINRLFWRSWFEFDHVDLNPARRDYLEHKFEAIKTISCRNQFAFPLLVSIPYYIYLGQKPVKLEDSAWLSNSSISYSLSSKADSTGLTMPDTPAATPIMQQQKHSMQDELPELQMPSAQLARQRNHGPSWTSHRLPYNALNAEQAQFKDYIYTFVWEDPEEDIRLMNIKPSDDMLVITSAGDNALDYLVNAGPASIHCVDMNPCQGHLLELKIAAFKRLDYSDVWKLFGAGKHPDFPTLLDQLAPELSNTAYQFWSARESAFDQCFYKSGYAGNVVKLLEWIFLLTGTRRAAKEMSIARNLPEQRKAWKTLRRAFISNTIGTMFLANPIFLWNALGVPINQLKMLQHESTALQYAIDTLDPVADKTLLSSSNFHYLLPILQHYTPESCPAYLKRNNYDLLSQNNGALLNSLVLHTETINNALASLPDNSLSKAIVMDHQDWFDTIPTGTPFPAKGSYLDAEIALFKRVLRSGGEVWWRSSARKPWYADRWTAAGFQVKIVSSRDGRDLLDKVNMYASTAVARLP